jgi:hypothetical protein
MNEAALASLFYNDLHGVANAQTLWERARPTMPTLTKSAVRDFLANQATTQRFRRLNPKPYHVPIIGKANQYSADLMFLDRGTKLNPILVVLELTSRKAYGRVMPNKTAETTAKAMREILGEIDADKQTMTSLEHDSGSEFRGAFLTLLNQRSIEDIRFPRGNASKTALGKLNVFVRTLRRMLEMATMTRGGDWRVYFPDVLKVYNDTRSTATGFTPNEVKDDTDANYIRARELGRNPLASTKVDRYKVGDVVRKLIETDIFSKKTKPKFSSELYTIASRDGYSFTLRDTAGRPVLETNENGEETLRPAVRLFRAWELLPVNKSTLQDVPESVRQPTQRLTEKEGRIARAVNKERRQIDAPTIEQDVPTPNVYEQTVGRPTRARRAPVAPVEEEARPKPKPKPRAKKQVEATITEVRGHRRVRGKLQFRVKWAHLDETANKPYEWVDVDNFAFPQPDGSVVFNTLVGEYMKAHHLP